jgi:hypothetical protein
MKNKNKEIKKIKLFCTPEVDNFRGQALDRKLVQGLWCLCALEFSLVFSLGMSLV